MFKVKSPDQTRTAIFSGKLSGDQITLTREVETAPGAAGAGQGLFSANGPRNIVVQRPQ
jgi:hypothetical protein